LDVTWICFSFGIYLISLLSLQRVGSDDDVGYGQNQVTEEGLNLEGMHPSLIILILCLQNCNVFYGYYMHAILILVASVSIDTLP
jgi:hypothetical protein